MAAAAVVGTEFDTDVVQHMLDFTDDDVFDALDEAAGAGIISEREGAIGRYAFAHVLVREVLYDGLSAIRRARLHRRAGDALDALRHNGSKPISALAHHYIEAAPVGDIVPAVDFARRATSLARRQLAYEEAVRVLERVLELLDDPGEDRDDDRLGVLLDLGEARSLAGDAVGAQSTFTAAVVLARAEGAAVPFANAVLGLSETLGGYAITVRQNPGLIELMEEALERLGPDDGSLRRGSSAGSPSSSTTPPRSSDGVRSATRPSPWRRPSTIRWCCSRRSRPGPGPRSDSTSRPSGGSPRPTRS